MRLGRRVPDAGGWLSHIVCPLLVLGRQKVRQRGLGFSELRLELGARHFQFAQAWVFFGGTSEGSALAACQLGARGFHLPHRGELLRLQLGSPGFLRGQLLR